MFVIIVITIYLLIGAILGYKDRETIQASADDTDAKYNVSKSMSRASNVVLAVGIILISPIFELYLLIRKIMSK